MAVPSGPAVALGRRVRARCDAASLILQRSPRWRRREAVAATPSAAHERVYDSRGPRERRAPVDAVAATPSSNAGPRRTNEDAFHEGETFFGVYDGHSGAISASRGDAVPSRHRCDSFPSHHEVCGFFLDFERVSGEIETRYITQARGP